MSPSTRSPRKAVALPEHAPPLVVATARQQRGAREENGVIWTRSPTSLDLGVTREHFERALGVIDAVVKKVEGSGPAISISNDHHRPHVVGPAHRRAG